MDEGRGANYTNNQDTMARWFAKTKPMRRDVWLKSVWTKTQRLYLAVARDDQQEQQRINMIEHRRNRMVTVALRQMRNHRRDKRIVCVCFLCVPINAEYSRTEAIRCLYSHGHDEKIDLSRRIMLDEQENSCSQSIWIWYAYIRQDIFSSNWPKVSACLISLNSGWTELWMTWITMKK